MSTATREKFVSPEAALRVEYALHNDAATFHIHPKDNAVRIVNQMPQLSGEFFRLRDDGAALRILL